MSLKCWMALHRHIKMNECLRFHILKSYPSCIFGSLLYRNCRMRSWCHFLNRKGNEVCDIQRQTCMCYMLPVNVGRLHLHTPTQPSLSHSYSVPLSLTAELQLWFTYGCSTSNGPARFICEHMHAWFSRSNKIGAFSSEGFHAFKHESGCSHTD